MKVEWDDAKNLTNQRKHGLSFEEAAELFTSGVEHLVIFDESHSEHEDRFISIGPLARGLVVVTWTEPEDDTIRIITARRASPREHVLYAIRNPRP